MSSATATQEILVEYTPIKIDLDTDYAVMSDTIQMVVDQGAKYVSEVSVRMINRVAALIVEMEPDSTDPRTTADRLEELYVFGLFIVGLVPAQLTYVSARLCKARHQRYIARLAEHARKFRSTKPVTA